MDALVAVNPAAWSARCFAAAARLVAGTQLALVDTGARLLADRWRRAIPVAAGERSAGRIRPAFGAIRVEGHSLVRAGVDRTRALLDLGVACLLAVLAHALLFVFSLSSRLSSAPMVASGRGTLSCSC